MISLNILPLDSEQFERATYGSNVSIKKVSQTTIQTIANLVILLNAILWSGYWVRRDNEQCLLTTISRDR